MSWSLRLVFVDPDNGIKPARGARTEKFAPFHELGGYLARGQGLIAYHHSDRSAEVPTQAVRLLASLAEETGAEPLAAVVARRGTVRFFLVVPGRDQRDWLENSLRGFEADWSPHVEIVWR